MADEEIQDSVTKAQQLVAEFAANKQRLKARGVEIGETITAGKFDDAAARDAILELFLELHDTALSLQSDLALVLLDALENPPVVEEEEDDSLLLHADAAQLRRTTLDYLDLLAQLVPRYEGAERAAIEAKVVQAKQSLALIDEIEEAGDEEEESEEDGGEEDEDDGAGADDN